MHRGRFAEAERQYREALALGAALNGPDSPELSATHAALASVEFTQDRFAEARAEIDRAIALHEAELGERGDLGHLLRMRAYALAKLGHGASAVATVERAIELRRREFGAASWQVADITVSAGVVEGWLGRHARAAARYASAIKIAEQLPQRPAEHLGLWTAFRAEATLATGDAKAAVNLAKTALASAPPGSTSTMTGNIARLVLADVLARRSSGRGRALDLATTAAAGFERDRDPDRAARAHALIARLRAWRHGLTGGSAQPGLFFVAATSRTAAISSTRSCRTSRS
ncbi:MAG: tetratricopeptide repeat protein [Kofleriaceae bacterium]